MTKIMKMTKNKIRAILAIALMTMSISTFGQVFMVDVEGERIGLSENEIELITPLHDVEYDQTNYTPLAGGTLLLVGLGMVYLLGCRLKNR